MRSAQREIARQANIHMGHWNTEWVGRVENVSGGEERQTAGGHMRVVTPRRADGEPDLQAS